MPPDFRAMIEPEHLGDQHPAVQVVFPKSAARDRDAAMDELFAAFPDHEPLPVSESDGEWRFRLTWTSEPRTFVDPGVERAAESLYGLSRPEIGGYREVHRWGGRDVVFSMVHAWALLAGSMAVTRRGGDPLGWVVHVDDHKDLGGPIVESLSGGMLRDGVFGADLVLADPDSVVAAIRRGVISKGNFLTAYLLGYPGARVVHVGEGLQEQSFELVRELGTTVLGGRPFPCSGFRLQRVSGHDGAFRQTRTIPEVIQAEGAGVWLDIDLDYFWNRYDGDSDNIDRVALPDEHEQVMHRVERMLGELSSAQWLTDIEAVSIAVSPGFFPTDHWASVIPAVRDGIRHILEP